MKALPFLTIHGHMLEAHRHLHELCLSGREAGREISKANLDKLGAVHDHMAKAIGASCRYHSDDYPSGADYKNAPRESMLEQEAIQMLEAAGYTVKW